MAKNNVIDEIKESSFINPIGSATNNPSFVGTPLQKVMAGVTGWQLRHTGSFSDNNPYYQQLGYASNNQDVDALYERAVEWEASQADYAQQLGVNFALMQEQRVYDSPLQQSIRNAEAGISTSFGSGSSGSGSSGSGSMQIPNLTPVDGDVKFSNSYDTTAQWINAFTGILGGVSSIGSAVVGAIDTFSTLPARRSLAQTQASLASQTLPHLVSSAAESASSNKLANVQSRLDMLGDLSTYFTSDTPDADIDTTLGTLGFESSTIPNLRNSIRNFQSNPELQRRFIEAKLDKADAEAKSANYSIELAGKIVQVEQQLQYEKVQFERNRTNLSNSLVTYLNNSSFAKNAADNITASSNLESQQIELQRMRVEQDTKAFCAQLEGIIGYYKYSQAVENEIYTRNGYYKNGKDINGKPRKLTPDEKAMIDAERVRRLYLSMAGSQQVQELINLYLDSSRNSYNYNTHMNFGSVLVEPTSEARKRFENITFHSILNSAPDDVGSYTNSFYKSLISSLPVIGGPASLMFE